MENHQSQDRESHMRLNLNPTLVSNTLCLLQDWTSALLWPLTRISQKVSSTKLVSFLKELWFWKHKRLLTSKLGNCSSVISNNPAFLRPFCLLELFNSTNADVGSIIDRADSSSQDKTQENISRFWILHDSHFWLWRCGRHANTAVIYAAGTSWFNVCKQDSTIYTSLIDAITYKSPWSFRVQSF